MRGLNRDNARFVWYTIELFTVTTGMNYADCLHYIFVVFLSWDLLVNLSSTLIIIIFNVLSILLICVTKLCRLF